MHTIHAKAILLTGRLSCYAQTLLVQKSQGSEFTWRHPTASCCPPTQSKGHALLLAESPIGTPTPSSFPLLVSRKWLNPMLSPSPTRVTQDPLHRVQDAHKHPQGSSFGWFSGGLLLQWLIPTHRGSEKGFTPLPRLYGVLPPPQHHLLLPLA